MSKMKPDTLVCSCSESIAYAIAAHCQQVNSRFLPFADFDELRSFVAEVPFAPESPAGVVVTQPTGLREVTSLARLLASYPRIRAVLCTSSEDPPALPGALLSAVQQRIRIVPRPSLGLAVRAVDEMLFDLEASSLCKRLVQCVPPGRVRVREMVRTILTSRPAPPGLETSAPPGTIAELAALLGLSRSYVSRLAHHHGVDTLELLDLWRVILALHLRESWGVPWDVIAWRLGFSSHSGLAAMVQRTVGLSLKALERVRPEDLMDAMFRRLAGGVRSAQ